MSGTLRIYFLIFCSLGFSISESQAQTPITRLDGYGGQPSITHQKYVDTKGDPFFFEDWEEAVVYAANGNQFSEVLLKFDLVSSELHFFVPELDKSYLLDMAVDSFHFVRDESPHFFVKLSDGRYYERLVTGEHGLYKRINKHMIESRPYGSADRVRTIRTKTNYFYKYEDDLIPVNTSRRAVLRALDSQSHGRLQEFVSSNKINLSTEEGLILAFQFLNQSFSSF